MSWVQTMFSLLGGGCFTVGTWLASSAYVTSRVPFTWVFGALLFVLSVGTVLTSIVIVSVHPKLRRLYIFIGVLCTLACGWSIVIMYQHPLIATTTPCPAGTYGASDMTNCLPCRCVHGNCSDGRNGDGSCDCDMRWRGRYYDRCDQNVLHNMANPDGPAKDRALQYVAKLFSEALLRPQNPWATVERTLQDLNQEWRRQRAVETYQSAEAGPSGVNS